MQCLYQSRRRTQRVREKILHALAAGEGFEVLYVEGCDCNRILRAQVYSSNPEINRNPNQIDENQVIRLGPLYSVRTGDTLMSIATKFGVTVNQVLCMVKVDCMPADRQC